MRLGVLLVLFSFGCARGGDDPGGFDAGGADSDTLDRCPAGQLECGAICADPDTDAQNCGDCGIACDPGKSCVGGACISDCPAGQTFCGECADTQTDATNCGGCGITCRVGATCNAGTCACPTGQIICGEGCVDPSSSTLFCGASGDCMGANVGMGCSGVCVGGACEAACPTGTTRCTNGDTPICADVTTHPMHCGMCGMACPAGTNERATCAAGACSSTCNTGFLDCDSADGCETDGASDEANCGACGTTCPSGRTCNAGVCSIVPENCGNGVDDDGDGATDCADSECTGSPSCMTGGGLCSGAVTLTSATGTIQDGSGASNYANSMSCSWLVSVPGARSITFDVREFATESSYDYLTVYEGTSASGRQLGRFSGSSLPGRMIANGSALFVTWTTDSSVVYPGFRADYTASFESCANGIDDDGDMQIDCADSECASNEACTAVPCGGNVTRSVATGRIQDGSGAGNYTSNMSCSWTITVPGASSIALSFSQFQSESGFDYIRVYRGTSASGTRVLEHAGSSVPGAATVMGDSMFVTWTTDGSVVYGGFIADYTAAF
jgi:hypothetical protein